MKWELHISGQRKNILHRILIYEKMSLVYFRKAQFIHFFKKKAMNEEILLMGWQKKKNGIFTLLKT